MELGYIVLRSGPVALKGIKFDRDFSTTCPMPFLSIPLYVELDRFKVIQDCRILNRRYRGVFLHYYLPITLYGVISESEFKAGQV